MTQMHFRNTNDHCDPSPQGRACRHHHTRKVCGQKGMMISFHSHGLEISARLQSMNSLTLAMLNIICFQVVIIQPMDTGTKTHPYPHALVAGIERYPSQITRRMSKTRQAKRSKVKPLIKIINFTHLMPTRYTLELEGLKGVVTNDTFKEVSQREEAKKTVKKALEDRYTSGKNRWFFTPLSKLVQYYHREGDLLM